MPMLWFHFYPLPPLWNCPRYEIFKLTQAAFDDSWHCCIRWCHETSVVSNCCAEGPSCSDESLSTGLSCSWHDKAKDKMSTSFQNRISTFSEEDVIHTEGALRPRRYRPIRIPSPLKLAAILKRKMNGPRCNEETVCIKLLCCHEAIGVSKWGDEGLSSGDESVSTV